MPCVETAFGTTTVFTGYVRPPRARSFSRWALALSAGTVSGVTAVHQRKSTTTGRTLHEGKLDTNYILAGARLPLRATLPSSACTRAARVELAIGKADPIAATVSPSQRRCAP